jgi:glutamine---fructose-6-phosphate transaminase (isomerizing)
MEQEVREQPSRLRENSERYSAELRNAIGGQEFDMVLLAARGSSDHAALYARYLFEIHLGIPVSLAAPSVLTRYGSRVRYPRCLAVGISQSGAAPDVSEVLSSLREDGHTTLAITNTPGSRLTQVAEHALLLEAGNESSVAATKTYTTSLLVLYQLVRALGAELPEPELPGEDWLASTLELAEAAQGPAIRATTLFALARGYSFCTAQETALKLMECALLPCKSYSTADFQHGPRALAGHGSAALCYGAAPEGLEEQGCEVILAPEAPTSAEEIKPVWEIFFGQWLALLAARARGLDPDRPEHIQKVTQTL